MNREGYGSNTNGNAVEVETLKGLTRWWSTDRKATAVWIDNVTYGEMASRKDLWHNNTRGSQSECPRGDLSQAGWYGGLQSVAQAEKMYVEGWKEGGERCQELADEIRRSIPPAIAIRPKRKWGADGDDMDAMRVMGGDADVAFRQTTRRATTGSPIITLLAPFGANCGMSQEHLFLNGAQSVVLCDLLEEAGYRVELLGAMCHHTRSGNSSDASGWSGASQGFFINVKGAHDVFRGDLAAATLAHAGTFRTLGFHALSCSIAPAGSGLGQMRELAEILPALSRYGLQPHFDAAIEYCYDKKGAIQRITETLFALEKARGIVRV